MAHRLQILRQRIPGFGYFGQDRLESLPQVQFARLQQAAKLLGRDDVEQEPLAQSNVRPGMVGHLVIVRGLGSQDELLSGLQLPGRGVERLVELPLGLADRLLGERLLLRRATVDRELDPNLGHAVVVLDFARQRQPRDRRDGRADAAQTNVHLRGRVGHGGERNADRLAIADAVGIEQQESQRHVVFEAIDGVAELPRALARSRWRKLMDGSTLLSLRIGVFDSGSLERLVGQGFDHDVRAARQGQGGGDPESCADAKPIV